MRQKSRKKLWVLGTGGTIAGLSANAHDNLGYVSAQVGVAQLAGSVGPAIAQHWELLTEQVAQIDSKDMDFDVWAVLAGRCRHFLSQEDVAGLVVTHGTDTLEETAYFLHRVFGSEGIAHKPVVLTGAMRPASSMASDGPQNLRDALAVAADPAASGVLVVFAGKVHGAVQVQKVHPYRLDAFDSGESGPIGFVEEGMLRLAVRGGWPAPPVPSMPLPALQGSGAGWPRVEIIMAYAGASARLIDALLSESPDDPLRGIVVAATGNGTLHKALEAGLLRARDAGVRVVRATRCSQGRVLAGAMDAIPDSLGLSPLKARIAMVLDLLQAAPAAAGSVRPLP